MSVPLDKVSLAGYIRNENLGEVCFIAHFQTVGANVGFWWMLTANCVQVTAFMRMSSYLAPYLTQTYRLSAGETALPLTIAGLEVIAGSLIGGRLAGQSYRLAVVAGAFLGGGLGAALVFITELSSWTTVAIVAGSPPPVPLCRAGILSPPGEKRRRIAPLRTYPFLRQFA